MKNEIFELLDSSEIDPILLDTLFFDFIDEFTKKSKVSFTGKFNKLVFYFNLELNRSLQDHLPRFWHLRKQILSKSYSSEILKEFAVSIRNILENNEIEIIKKDNSLSYIYAVITDKTDQYLKCNSDEIGVFFLVLKNELEQFNRFLRQGMSLSLVDFELSEAEELALSNKRDSLLSIEPDYLIDVTDIASCFSGNFYNENIYYLNKFTKTESSESLVLGNLVNLIFDALVEGNEIDINKYLYNRPLPIFLLGSNDNRSIEIIREKANSHLENLELALEDISFDSAKVEPSFYSYRFGLSGRLDILLEYEDKDHKDIIELKSGKYPRYTISYNINGKNLPSNIWINHLAQTTCYNLLLDSVYENRRGVSQILYSAEEENPFRDSLNDISIKKQVLELRNKIVLIEYAIALGKTKIYEGINPNGFGNRAPYLDEKIYNFHENYSQKDDLEKRYFEQTTSYLSREIFASKTGLFSQIESSGFNDLWRGNNYSDDIIKKAKINFDLSDLENNHLIFEFENEVHSFRVGDQVILFQSYNFKGEIIKGVIRDIFDDQIKISLRNKLTDIIEYESFSIAKDHSDTNTKRIFPFLNELSRSEIKEYIYGRHLSKQNSRNDLKFEVFNENQRKVLEKAVQSGPYYLIQGPPGTGKTSIILKNLINYYSKDKVIYLSAYTNKAIENISEVLKNLGHDYLRIGSKESTKDENLISHFNDIHGNKKLWEKIQSTRIVIGTVFSLYGNSEIFELVKPEVMLIDEAGQILEYQLVGLIALFEKFILIGDEKQLPAISIQKKDYAQIHDEILNEYEIKDNSESLFERLLRLNKKHENFDAFGLLETQGRMNEMIMNLPNKLFYNNELETIVPTESNEYDSDLLNQINNKRIVFIQSDIEFNYKRNNSEINIINRLVDILNNDLNIDDIGIISPFRLQCAQIKRSLNKDIDTDTVERFQGSEKQAIIYSFACNYENNLKQVISPKQIDDKVIDRKLNVAITRAKEYLFILGNENILNKYIVFSDMIKIIKEEHLFLHNSEIDI